MSFNLFFGGGWKKTLSIMERYAHVAPDGLIMRLGAKFFLRQKKRGTDYDSQSLLNFGGMCGGRTHDKRIKSPLLYQLS